MLTVAGAGMGGLVAAVRARELGTAPVVLEKGTRAGGSMRLSSCVIWRYRDWDDFRAECPGGDAGLQRVLHDRLDDAIAWLESIGAPVVDHETGNPRTTGKRFDPRGLTETLVARAGDLRFSTPLGSTAETPLVLATGGFGGDRELVRRHITPEADGLLLRANPWSAGDGLRFALERGGSTSVGMEEFYGRNMPAPPARVTEADYVPLAQLYGRWATVFDSRGDPFFESDVSWSEIDLVQATALQPGARAWYVLDDGALGERVRGRSVADMVEAARQAGATVVGPSELSFEVPAGARVAIHVAAGITHTIGGLSVDVHGRVVGADGLWACGADVGGISTGGYASGLAAALVFGLAAAESACA